VNLDRIKILGLDRELVIARGLVLADHLVELGHERFDKIQHEIALFDHLMLDVSNLFLGYADVVNQPEREFLDLHDSGIDDVFLVTCFELMKLVIELFRVGKTQALFHVSLPGA